MRFRSILAVALLAIPLFASAQEAKSEQILVNKSDLPAAIVQDLETRQKVESYGAYIGLGKELGVAVNESLSAVTEQTAKFADTSVGRVTMAIVIYKVVGRDFVHYVAGTVFFFIAGAIWLWSYNRNCVTRKVLVEDSKEKGKKWNIVNTNVSEASAATHTVFAIGIIGVSCIIFFT